MAFGIAAVWKKIISEFTGADFKETKTSDKQQNRINLLNDSMDFLFLGRNGEELELIHTS